MKLRTTFRTKLLLLTIVPLGVAQIVTLFAVMRTVEHDVDARARESLKVGAVVVNEFLAAHAEQLRTSVEVLAADYGLKEAVATGDAVTIRSVLDNHSRRVGAGVAALLDLDGEAVASNLRSGANLIVDPKRLDIDSGRVSREYTTILGKDAYHMFIVPLRAPVTVGWVVLGFRIDAELTNQIADLTGLDTSIVQAGEEPLTISTSRSEPPQGIDVETEFNSVYMALDDAEHALTVQTPFVRSEKTVLVVLQRSMRDAMQPYAEARSGLVAFGTAMLILVGIAGGWLSTTIARPLKTLGAAARRMISGDYETSIAVRSDDEFGQLASSFNAMQQAIAEREQRISHQAMHDPLTDLPNRSKMLTVLTGVIEQARRSDAKVTVLAIQLLRMGEISSTLGHHATDELIRMAARHLRANLDGGELLGHTGTNEFVLVLPDNDVANALSYVDRIEGLLGSGVTLGRVNVILQTRIGIAEFPGHGEAAADLLRFAAIARAEADANNERMRVYAPGREDEFVRRLRIVNDLPSAIRRGDVQVWLQPKIALPGGAVCGAEALVRWQHPELGFLSPDDFVSAAEQSGTIVLLTRFMLEQAVRECRRLEQAGHILQVSVNLSARDLMDEYLPYHVMQILTEQNLPPERLTLEVTENSVMEDLRHAVTVLECIRDIGVRISMDDFGTGHSSLAQLRNIPLHELKIDKSFVMTLMENAHNESIVKTTVQLAHSMDLSVVAEGVENEACMHRIADLGCQQAQGYFISKPVPAAELLAWLENYRPTAYAERRSHRRAFSGM